MCPQNFGRERVEVGKGGHVLGVCRVVCCAKLVSKLGTEDVLHVRVTGEFDKGPLCKTN